MNNMYKENSVTEQEFVNIVNAIMDYLSSCFTFGSYEVDDIRQQGFIIAIKFLKSNKYDGVRPLKDILFVHLKNRLKNFIRDNHVRIDSPCKKCPLYDVHFRNSSNQCLKYEERLDCEIFKNWKSVVDQRMSIISPASYHNNADLNEPFYEVDNTEEETGLIDLINSKLDPVLRADFLKLIVGIKLAPKRKGEIQVAIAEIMKEDGREVPRVETESPKKKKGK